MIKVLLADDHPIVRSGIKRLLQEVASFKVVGEASTGEETVALARQLSADVVLMDIQMPGIGALEATLKLQRVSPDIKVLVITAREDILFTERLLQGGASGYLTQGAPIDEMIRAIKMVHLGQRYIPSELTTKLALKHMAQTDKSPFDQLSERELQIATLIVKGIQAPVIAEQLCLSPKTVNTYRYRIFDKLDIHSDVELTHLALQYNLLEENTKNVVLLC